MTKNEISRQIAMLTSERDALQSRIDAAIEAFRMVWPDECQHVHARRGFAALEGGNDGPT